MSKRNEQRARAHFFGLLTLAHKQVGRTQIVESVNDTKRRRGTVKPFVYAQARFADRLQLLLWLHTRLFLFVDAKMAATPLLAIVAIAVALAATSVGSQPPPSLYYYYLAYPSASQPHHRQHYYPVRTSCQNGGGGGCTNCANRCIPQTRYRWVWRPTTMSTTSKRVVGATETIVRLLLLLRTIKQSLVLQTFECPIDRKRRSAAAATFCRPALARSSRCPSRSLLCQTIAPRCPSI